ncbi:MAG: prolyl oligopeptidase family serine peptidase [Crocinitomicaceae bacterium]
MAKLIISSTLLIISILSNSYLFSQSSALKLEEIMTGNDFIGHQPENIQWAPDSKSFYFTWDKENTGITTYYEYTLKSGELKKLEPGNTTALPVDGHFRSENWQKIFYRKDQTLYELQENRLVLVFNYLKYYSVYKVDNDGNVIVQIEDNLYRLDRKLGQYNQITNFIKGSKSTDVPKSYLEDQQEELFDYVKQQNKKTEIRKKERELYHKDYYQSIYLNDRSLDWVEYANGGTKVIYESSNYPKDETTDYMSYVNSSGHATARKARSKVGKKDPDHMLYIHHTFNDSSQLVDISLLEGIYNKPLYLKEYGDTVSKLSQPKNVIYHSHGFNSNHTYLLVEIKSYDNKDRWITILDMNGNLHQIDHQHDEAWIGGPGISGWNMVPGNCGWINNTNLFYQSEESGYSHLYSFNTSNQKKDQLTNGQFEIHEAWLSKDKSRFFISANKNHPGNREFYTLEIASKKLTSILTTEGNHEVSVSPDEKYLAVRYSYKNKPWEIYTCPLKENTVLKQVTDSRSEKFKSHNWIDPQVISYKASDGVDVHARLYTPNNELKNGAAVIFVHGAGYLQNAHNWWSDYYREYMFNNLLAEKGFTVLDIDYRASKGYGRDFRTGIYRFMGGKDLSDHLDGRQLLIDQYNIDRSELVFTVAPMADL